MADTHKKFQQLILNHYMLPKYRIHEKLIHFEIAGPNPNIDTLYIGEFDIVLRFLRNFGKFIKSLELSGLRFTIEENVQINYFIEEYCWHSLEELTLHRTISYLLNGTARIFPNIKKLNIVIPEKMDNFQIHRVYPMMESLTFASETFPFTSMLHKNHNLKNLTFDLINPHEIKDFSNACGFLRKNSQLQQLNLYRSPSFELLKCASEDLPNLSTLNVEFSLDELSWKEHRGTVHFVSVRRFNMFTVASLREAVDPFPITFEGLETLEILVGTASYVPFDLIEQSVDLKFLSLPNTHWLNGFSRIADVIRDLHQLKVVKLKWTDDISDMDTMRIMTESDQLKEITFSVMYKQSVRGLIALIPDTWKLAHIKQRKIHLFIVFDVTIVRK